MDLKEIKIRRDTATRLITMLLDANNEVPEGANHAIEMIRRFKVKATAYGDELRALAVAQGGE